MPSFSLLLISTCDIQVKARSLSGYEKVLAWTDLYTSVKTRKDSATSAKISDADMRLNTDDDIFFFNTDVNIKRGHRIVFDGDNYDVIKVNKCYDAVGIHHLEVVARIVDHD